ncbi:MAG: hypothetical protein WBL11_04845 [Bacteroidales bacterium]|jgi:hypothetical protein|nr:hypothetical protein [Bacteroidales bacterium]MDI9575284.1 hypothetical protein [Bacteroidota bacterium]MDD2593673.1 hypothetical protein [Bacteroidales bacterium]MDD3755370.1 hypothetical protein [Bacteroidales bacterium]MDY0400644.1 hypothetical protein [Bacteroidales bacterium]
MKSKNTIFIVLFLIITHNIYPQSWRINRHAIGLNLGVTNFLGDLGGGKSIGQPFIYDLDIQATRPLIGITYNYKIDKVNSLSTHLSFGYLRGDDAFTKNPIRNNRNLNFRSPIIELTEQYELILYNSLKGRETKRYKLRGVKGWTNYEIYAFVGIGLFWFNPQGKAPDGKWHNLKPLCTEGQGLDPQRKPYHRLQFTIPYGVGFRYNTSREWSYGFAIAPRITFTDYIDDCSTTYFNNDIIRNMKGDLAAYFADPSKGEVSGQTLPGEQRGDPKDKDSYFFIYFTVNYSISALQYKTNKAKFY